MAQRPKFGGIDLLIKKQTRHQIFFGYALALIRECGKSFDEAYDSFISQTATDPDLFEYDNAKAHYYRMQNMMVKGR